MISLPTSLTFFERGWLSSNNVLLHDETQAILVDTGYHSHANQTLSLVQSALGEQLLTRVINTHLHSDHCGGNALLQTSYANLEVHIPPGHACLVDSWDSAGLTYEPTGQYCPRFSKTHVLSHGNTFCCGDLSWLVLAAAGHDPHSVIIFNESQGILISADALWENGFGVVFPEIEGVSAFDDVEQTLNMIERLNPHIVLPGHGSAFSDVKTAMSRARSRLNQFRSSPDKHASYAAKVLLKFKLLELQSIKIDLFLAWTDRVSYLILLHKTYAPVMAYREWILFLCKELEKSGACKREQDTIINI
jgi:glyoxylase-like metal-dependent hydrolase (beta-lactamase superfamily II)